MTTTFRHIPSSESAAGAVVGPLVPVADSTNVIPLIAAAVLPRIERLIRSARVEPFELSMGEWREAFRPEGE